MHYFMGIDHERRPPASWKRDRDLAGASGGREMSQYRIL